MERRTVALVCLLLAAAVCLVYGRVGSHQFLVFDDDEYIYANPQVTNGLTREGLAAAVTAYTGGNWHPLTMLSHMLDCELFGVHPGRHLIVNVLLHAANATGLLVLLWRLTGRLWAAAFVAALFALHPLNVETVAWASQRKSLLSTLFFLLTLHGYVTWCGKPRGWLYLLTLGLFVLGLLSKPMLVTLPCVLLLLDFWPLQRLQLTPASLVSRVREKLPFFALSVLACLCTLQAQRAMGAVVSAVEIPLSRRLANALYSYGWYLWKTFLPTNLGVFYPFPSGFSLLLSLGLLLLLVLLSLLLWRGRQSHPHALVGWVWYLGTLVPVIGLVQVGVQARADRYAYLPLIGVFIAVVWQVDLWLRQHPQRLRRTVAAGGALIVLLFALQSMRQVARWQNGLTLFQHTILVCGDSPPMRNNLGTTYLLHGKLRESIPHFEAVIAQDPSYERAYVNLGNTLNQLGYANRAIPILKHALDLRPGIPEAEAGLGSALIRLGRAAEGIPYVEAAAARMPLFAYSYAELADAYAQEGNLEQAAVNYERALAVQPDLHEARRRLARVLKALDAPAPKGSTQTDTVP